MSEETHEIEYISLKASQFHENSMIFGRHADYEDFILQIWNSEEMLPQPVKIGPDDIPGLSATMEASYDTVPDRDTP